jgi:hypothetical protein
MSWVVEYRTYIALVLYVGIAFLIVRYTGEFKR